MAKILVTGSKGQLGNEIGVLAKATNHSFYLTDFDVLDITDSKAVEDFLSRNKISFLVNCAAYTAVDKAQVEIEKAEKLNAKAPENLAKLCALHNIIYIHISTDYVFDGTNHIPYVETDPVKPVSVYGKTKLEGEQLVLQENPNSIVIRTSWLYSEFGNNFVKTMLRLGKEKTELNVIFDQIGTPTYAYDLARHIIQIIDKISFSSTYLKPGIYHYSNEGVCSWYDFAKEIFSYAGITSCKVKPIETKDYPTPATRPNYSVLNKAKIKEAFSFTIPYWKESLHTCLQKLIQ